MPTPRPLVASLTALAATVLALAGPAAARTVELVSPGSAGVVNRAIVDGISADGEVAFFHTQEAIAPGDDADSVDVYARVLATAALHRVTLSTPFQNGDFNGASADGMRVWYATPQADLPADADATYDVYELRLDVAPPVRRRISDGDGAFPATFVGGTADGAYVAYLTAEPVLTADVDAQPDVYARRADGSTVLLTPGTAGAVTTPVVLRDGSGLLFETAEGLAPGGADVDGAVDLYEVPLTGGAYRLRSTWPGTTVFRVTDPVDGRMWVQVAAPLVGADTDAADDVYAIARDGSPALLSGGTADLPATLQRVSADGFVGFTTAEPLLPADGDGASDLYVAAPDGALRGVGLPGSGGGTLRLLGPGGAVVFFTDDALVPSDDPLDTENDLYEQSAAGTLRLLTPGTTGEVAYAAIEAFDEPEAPRPLLYGRDVPGTGDANGVDDTYELAPAGILKLGPAALTGASGLSALNEPAESADGGRILVSSRTAVAGTADANAAEDVYVVSWVRPSFAGPPVATGTGRVGSTLACAPTSATGDEAITVMLAWLRDGAPITGATAATYRVAAADAGAALACRATASGPAGTDVETSAPIQVAPTAGTPALTGFPIVGTRLACAATFQGADAVVYAWRRGATLVAGRTSRTYLLGAADRGRRVTCEATGTAGTASTTVSARRGVPAQCVVPRLRGATSAAAGAALRARGCRVLVKRVKGAGVARGRVLRTSPKAGRKIANGRVVTLLVRR